MTEQGIAQQWYMAGSPWELCQTELDPEKSIYFETVLSQANGHLGVRAYNEEPSNAESLREGYLAGVFSHLGPEATKLAGPRNFPVSEMITIPEIFACTLVLNGEQFQPEKGIVSCFHRILDMRNGELTRQLTWESPTGNRTRLSFRRFLSAKQPSLTCHAISIIPDNWDGQATATWELDGTIQTLVRFGAKRFPQHPQDHLRVVESGIERDTDYMHLKTRGTDHDIVIAAIVSDQRATSRFPEGNRLQQTLTLPATANHECHFERSLAIVTSRDYLTHDSVKNEALATANQGADVGYDAELAESTVVWEQRWELADIQIDGPARDQKVIRYNLFQLLQMAPWHSDRMSLAPRALAFNRYRGTYFWDTETFILPFYSTTFPEVARNLLSYRYHALDGARETAADHQAAGALYPWMTEPDRGEDHSLFKLTSILWHQTADVAYAVGQYADISGDIDFMAERGMEILAESARFWVSKITYDEAGVGHIDGALGPDETGGPGLDNGFTCLMARRNLRLAVSWYKQLSQSRPQAIEALCGKLQLSEKDVADWEHAAESLNIPVIPDLNVPLQDDKFLAKKPAPPEIMAFRDNPSAGEVPTTREGYQVIKQADIVLAMLQLQDEFSVAEIATAYDYYEPKTLHISSLSKNTHAVVAAILGRVDIAYDWFINSAAMDIDNFDNCTADGLHAAAIGGCWQGLVYGFAGLHLTDDGLQVRPNLPTQWRSMTFTINDQGRTRKIQIPTQS